MIDHLRLRRLRPATAALLLGLALAGCGAPNPPIAGDATAPPAAKLRHQIVFGRGDAAHVFEGYMIRRADAFIVRAFAGPGVDLFTVIRNGQDRAAQLHIGELADRIDMEVVASSISRVYLGGCPSPASPQETECTLDGEKMIERRDASGRLTERRFPTAHDVGLRISYSDYRAWSGEWQPSLIELVWGDDVNAMAIRLVDYEVVDHVDPAVFDVNQLSGVSL